MVQSGGMVKAIWDKALAKLDREGQKVNKALVLGLGCGDCVFSINRHYPYARVTGVELDPEVINMAECYFNLATAKNLKVAISEGADYVAKKTSAKGGAAADQKFDLIIVDVYLGQVMPKKFKEKKFLANLAKLVAKNGVVVINHLFFGGHKKEAERFIKDLEKIWPQITLQRTASNLVIFARK